MTFIGKSASHKPECVVHSFPPVYDDRSKILILGTIPSVRSRETGYYYGNPRNRFWKIISLLLKKPQPETVFQKQDLLLEHGIALYDVLSACEIQGSADATIRCAQPNDLQEIFQTADIRMVFTNGKKAYELYQKLCKPQTKRDSICLKSTSPANAAARIEDLLENWAQILPYLR
jgi:TDG/mug DNA glycosylase family protein